MVCIILRFDLSRKILIIIFVFSFLASTTSLLWISRTIISYANFILLNTHALNIIIKPQQSNMTIWPESAAQFFVVLATKPHPLPPRGAPAGDLWPEPSSFQWDSVCRGMTFKLITGKWAYNSVFGLMVWSMMINKNISIPIEWHVKNLL